MELCQSFSRQFYSHFTRTKGAACSLMTAILPTIFSENGRKHLLMRCLSV